MTSPKNHIPVLVAVSDADIDRIIAEDVGYGDLTTSVLGIGAAAAWMSFSARQAMAVCGIEEAARMLTKLGAQARTRVSSGAVVQPGALLLEAEGSAASLFAAWKVAQTFVEWSSGIASAVHDVRMAAAAINPDIVVACTRKTSPLSRQLTIKAVLAGGGVMHRTGLSESVLVFPEHCAFLGDNEAAHIARLRKAAPERKLVAEVNDVEGALRFAAAGIDVLQLEKFAPADVTEVVKALRERQFQLVLAVAGGVNANNAAAYAEAGADVLVTSWPYWAGPRDVQVRMGAIA